jgi:hypothetical protein
MERLLAEIGSSREKIKYSQEDMKNADLSDILCGSCNIRRFGGKPLRPDDGGDNFLRHVSSYKRHTESLTFQKTAFFIVSIVETSDLT